MRLCYAASYLPVPDPLWTLIMLRQVIVLTVAALLLWVVANLVLLQPGDTGPAPQSGFPAPLPETPVPRRSERTRPCRYMPRRSSEAPTSRMMLQVSRHGR